MTTPLFNGMERLAIGPFTTEIGGLKLTAEDWRLDLSAEMDASGNMAGILSGLGLLQADRLESGYWPGFRFRIWGSLEEPKSNFPQIVTEAATGTLTRNVTNPFLGIWSNVKFRGTEVWE